MDTLHFLLWGGSAKKNERNLCHHTKIRLHENKIPAGLKRCGVVRFFMMICQIT